MTILATVIVRRILQSIPLLIAVLTIMFVLLELAPGDPVQALVGEYPVTQEYRDELVRKFELDQPMWKRYVSYVANTLTGNFGYSFANSRAVSELILERVPNTLLLTLSGLSLAAFTGVAVGVFAATASRRSVGATISVGALAGYSLPAFWLGQILILVFAVWLDWLPAQGMIDLRSSNSGLAHAADVALHLLLPMVVLAAREYGIITRISRASMLEVLSRDFITTARAKGQRELYVIWRHGLRNALMPIVTVIGYSFGFAMSGSVLVETVFGWPGMGRLLYDSIGRRDNAVILGIFFVIACTVIIANIITDTIYAMLDPRVRLGARSR